MSIHFRMISSLMLMLVLFTITTILVNLDSDTWQTLFFIITLTTVIFLNSEFRIQPLLYFITNILKVLIKLMPFLVGSSIMQGAVFNLVTFFDSGYMTATVCGQALGGIVAALAQILALWWGASSVHSAFVYFLFADIFILLSLVLYSILIKTVSTFKNMIYFQNNYFLKFKNNLRFNDVLYATYYDLVNKLNFNTYLNLLF